MQFTITFKTIFEYILKKLVLCIQIGFVSTEKTTRIASRASCYITRCTRGVRVVFSVTRMRSSNSARINKFDFRTEKSCSVHMTVFEIVAGHNVVNWMQLLT